MLQPQMKLCVQFWQLHLKEKIVELGKVPKGAIEEGWNDSSMGRECFKVV